MRIALVAVGVLPRDAATVGVEIQNRHNQIILTRCAEIGALDYTKL